MRGFIITKVYAVCVLLWACYVIEKGGLFKCTCN